MSSSRLHSRLPLKLTGLQTTPVALLLMPCESGGDIASGEATGDQFDPSKSESPTKLWRLCPWDLHRLQPPVVHQVNLLAPSPTTGARGPRFHTNWRRGALVRQARDPFRSLANWKRKHNLCLLPFHTTTQPHTVATERTDKPTVCCYRRQWNPCHMDFWSCSSKPLTGRTGHQLRDASAPGTTGDTAFTGLSPTTGQGLVPRRHAL